jgi:hypothetical protein
VNPVSARGLVPPRPNLGPDPWSEAQPISPVLIVTGILAGLLVAWLIWTRLRRRRKAGVGRDLATQQPPDSTPRGRLVAHSDSIREVLANQFGTAWRAKTTEELSAEPRLDEILGRDQLQELIRFLDQVDHLKFAPLRSKHHPDLLAQELATWEPRLADLTKKIQTRPEGRAINTSKSLSA